MNYWLILHFITHISMHAVVMWLSGTIEASFLKVVGCGGGGEANPPTTTKYLDKKKTHTFIATYLDFLI